MKPKHLIYTKRVMSVIRNIRRRKDYSQEYMAIRLDISQNAYSKLEAGKTPLTFDRLNEICNILEIELGELLSKTNTSDNGNEI